MDRLIDDVAREMTRTEHGSQMRHAVLERLAPPQPARVGWRSFTGAAAAVLLGAVVLYHDAPPRVPSVASRPAQIPEARPVAREASALAAQSAGSVVANAPRPATIDDGGWGVDIVSPISPPEPLDRAQAVVDVAPLAELPSLSVTSIEPAPIDAAIAGGA